MRLVDGAAAAALGSGCPRRRGAGCRSGWSFAGPLARGGRVDRRAVEALLGRHGLAAAAAAELWAAAGGDDLEGLARCAAADGAESRSAASAIDALRHDLRRCAARADRTNHAPALFREIAKRAQAKLGSFNHHA